MKHKVSKQLVSLVLSLIMMAAAPLAALAVDAVPITIPVDTYSPWAEVDVFMAKTAYGLGDESTYSNYQAALTAGKFMPVYEELAETFGVEGSFIPSGELITRGEVVAAYYEIMTGALAKSVDEAAAFFVDAGLLAGRNAGDYGLDKACTVEEMIVFSDRVYEYLAYKAGKDSKGFFWEVRGGANKVYLLGSIHISDGSMYPLSKAIEGAFAKSKNLVVEADIYGNMEIDQMALFQKGMIPADSGKTIKDFMAPELYEAYASVCSSLGLPAEVYDYMKPWLANIVMQGLALTSGETEAQLGVDIHFLMKAYAANKNVIELEGAMFQYDMFASFSDELQTAQLASSLAALMPSEAQSADGASSGEGQASDGNTAQQAVAMLLEIVKKGDDEAMTEILGVNTVYDDPLDIEFNTKVFTDRNKGMADKIIGFLGGESGKGDYFVVVGAGHMLGNEGIVALLSGKGYEVVRIK